MLRNVEVNLTVILLLGDEDDAVQGPSLLPEEHNGAGRAAIGKIDPDGDLDGDGVDVEPFREALANLSPDLPLAVEVIEGGATEIQLVSVTADSTGGQLALRVRLL